MKPYQIKAIQDTIQARNEAINLLNSVAFNPSTRPEAYRAQQQLIEELQEQHAAMIKETANG